MSRLPTVSSRASRGRVETSLASRWSERASRKSNFSSSRRWCPERSAWPSSSRRFRDWRTTFSQRQAAADRLGVRLDVLEARTAEDIDRLFAAATAQNTRVDAMHVHGMPFFIPHRDRIVALAKTRRLPAMYFSETWVTAGGLMSFGPDFVDLHRRMAGHVDKILKGARPADIPVEEPTKYVLAINVRTARELGLTVHSLPRPIAWSNDAAEVPRCVGRPPSFALHRPGACVARAGR